MAQRGGDGERAANPGGLVFLGAAPLAPALAGHGGAGTSARSASTSA
ncbi:hypothetical protein [Mobilicoccus caccae]|nr:hypothetical protein [Mobilicoccus caccae]